MSNKPSLRILTKCNEKLQTALLALSANDELTIVATLRVGGDKPNMPDPKDYPSRVEYRKACIEVRKEYIKRETEATMSKLKQLPLNISQPEVGRVTVISGTRKHVLKALRLDGIEHASLNEEINMLSNTQMEQNP